TLPPFEYHAPSTLEEAVSLLSRFRGHAKVIAGGTDLLPNMKHRLFTPSQLVALRAIRGLDSIDAEDGSIRPGAACTVAELAPHPIVKSRLPSLADAASQIAGPQLREMGTLGGNLCLDTRCVYYNQTYFWRHALGFCLKKDGTVCHVVQGGSRCVAAASNDTAPVLMTLDAQVRLAGPGGVRDLPLLEFYTPDGIRNTVLGEDELVTEVRIPTPSSATVAGYQKLRIRASIDYPALTVAVAAELKDGLLVWVRVAISALGARPHYIGRLEGFRGQRLNPQTISELGQACHKQCHPLTNLNVDPPCPPHPTPLPL